MHKLTDVSKTKTLVTTAEAYHKRMEFEALSKAIDKMPLDFWRPTTTSSVESEFPA
jgi:hypothetical protein